jgi:hypothetical protein
MTFRVAVRRSYRPSALLFALVIVLAALSLLSGYVLIHYFNKDVLSSITYDSNDGWCLIGTESIGTHCFGDYSSVVLSAAQQNPWIAVNGHVSNYPASGMLPQFLFGSIGALFGSHLVGLFAYLLVLTAALISPAIWASRGKTLTMRLLTVFLFGLFSAPALMTLERGNAIGFVVPALLAYLVALRRGNYTVVVIAIVLASLVKPQFALLVLALFILRKWRHAILAFSGVVAANLLAYLAWPRDFPETLWQSALAILRYGGGVSLADDFPANVSLAKGMYWVEHWARKLFGFSNLHSLTAQNAGMIGAAIVLIAMVILLILGRRLPSHVAGIVLLALTSLFVSTTWSYYLVFALPVAAIILRDPSNTELGRHRWRGVFDQALSSVPKKIAVALTVLAVAATVAQVPLPIGASIPGQPPVNFAGSVVVHTTVDAVPVLWLIAAFAILVAWLLPDTKIKEKVPSESATAAA